MNGTRGKPFAGLRGHPQRSVRAGFRAARVMSGWRVSGFPEVIKALDPIGDRRAVPPLRELVNANITFRYFG